MAAHKQAPTPENPQKSQKRESTTQDAVGLQTTGARSSARAAIARRPLLQHRDMLALQRAMGNRAVQRLISAPSISPASPVIQRYSQQELDAYKNRADGLLEMCRNLTRVVTRDNINLSQGGSTILKATIDSCLHQMEALQNEIQNNYDEDTPGEGNGSDIGGALYEARWTFIDDVLGGEENLAPIKKAGLDRFFRGQAAAGNLSELEGAGKVAYQTSLRAGQINWVSGADQDETNHFRTWLAGDEADIVLEQGLPSMNCWEGVLYSAFKAGVITKAKLKEIYTTENITAAIEQAIGPQTSLRTLKNEGGEVQAGDIVIFYEVAKHVAISLGGNSVMSLWNQPGPQPVFMQTTITKLAELAETESLDNIYIVRNSPLFTPG